MSQAPADSVSVLVPCYKAAAYLPQALDSALAQAHRPAHIVCVDDGSPDECAQIVRQYIDRYPDRHIELISQPNKGEVGARNTGIAAAKRAGTAWVAMLDADDWWEPQKLELQLAAAHEAGPQCVLVHTGCFTEHPDGRTTTSDMEKAGRRVGRCLEALLEPGSIVHPSILVRMDALEKVGGYDPDFPHGCDVNLYFHLAAIGTFAFVPQPLVHYRIHPGQTSFNFKLDQTRYQVRVVQDFFAKRPELAAQIGQEKIGREVARFVELKLESLYWRRRLSDFRGVLAFAQEKGIDSPAIAAWRRRARWPDWAVRLKDKLTG